MKTFQIPDLGEGMTTADVIKILIKPGDEIKNDQVVLEIETDKVVLEIPSTISGTVKEVLITEGSKVKVGQDVFTIEESGETTVQDQGKDAKENEEEKTEKHAEEEPDNDNDKDEDQNQDSKNSDTDKDNADDEPLYSSPTVRNLARELGVDVQHIRATGDKGRITKDDVQRAKDKPQSAKKQASQPDEFLSLPDLSKWGEISRKSMTAIQRKTATHLSLAWQAPHVTQSEKADITVLTEKLKDHAEKAKKAGGKLTITAVLVQLTALALKEFPLFAASLDMKSEEIVFRKYYHIGLAVDTERGLLVPVIRDADKKTIINLSVEIKDLAAKARDKKLSLDELQGGVFSITNLGGFGGTHFTPVINPPEVAVLGVSRSRLEPVYQKDNELKPRLMLPLSLSYDHRIINGASGIKFLRWICDRLENPEDFIF